MLWNKGDFWCCECDGELKFVWDDDDTIVDVPEFCEHCGVPIDVEFVEEQARFWLWASQQEAEDN